MYCGRQPLPVHPNCPRRSDGLTDRHTARRALTSNGQRLEPLLQLKRAPTKGSPLPMRVRLSRSAFPGRFFSTGTRPGRGRPREEVDALAERRRLAMEERERREAGAQSTPRLTAALPLLPVSPRNNNEKKVRQKGGTLLFSGGQHPLTPSNLPSLPFETSFKLYFCMHVG